MTARKNLEKTCLAFKTLGGFSVTANTFSESKCEISSGQDSSFPVLRRKGQPVKMKCLPDFLT